MDRMPRIFAFRWGSCDITDVFMMAGVCAEEIWWRLGQPPLGNRDLMSCIILSVTTPWPNHLLAHLKVYHLIVLSCWLTSLQYTGTLMAQTHGTLANGKEGCRQCWGLGSLLLVLSNGSPPHAEHGKGWSQCFNLRTWDPEAWMLYFQVYVVDWKTKIEIIF